MRVKLQKEKLPSQLIYQLIYQLKRVADCYLHKHILSWILLFNALFFLAFPSKHSLFSNRLSSCNYGLLRVSKELIYLF